MRFSNLSIYYARCIATMCLHYFGSAIVVFGGYRIPSTKYIAHQRCTGSKIGVEATFTEDMKLTTTKDIFLADVANKYNFILLWRQDVGILAGRVSVDGCYLKETEWGWMEEDGHLVQIMTYLYILHQTI